LNELCCKTHDGELPAVPEWYWNIPQSSRVSKVEASNGSRVRNKAESWPSTLKLEICFAVRSALAGLGFCPGKLPKYRQ